MVELKVTLGSKGQLVLPKIFRDYYEIYPNHQAVIKSTEEGILITKNREDSMKIFEKIAEAASKKRKSKSVNYKKEEFYEQYEKRAKRAGL